MSCLRVQTLASAAAAVAYTPHTGAIPELCAATCRAPQLTTAAIQATCRAAAVLTFCMHTQAGTPTSRTIRAPFGLPDPNAELVAGYNPSASTHNALPKLICADDKWHCADKGGKPDLPAHFHWPRHIRGGVHWRYELCCCGYCCGGSSCCLRCC